MLDNFMGAEIAQDEIGWDNMVEGRMVRAWRDIQEQHITEKEYCSTALGWAVGVVVGMLEMVHSWWKNLCNIVNKWKTDGLTINHNEWLKVQVQLQMAKGTERME